MNQLTRSLVIQTAKKYKSAAKKNDSDFGYLLGLVHWDNLINRLGPELQSRAMRLFARYHPELFDSDGYIKSYDNQVYDLELEISRLCVRIIERKIQRDPELRLDLDYGDLPERIADPQLVLF